MGTSSELPGGRRVVVVHPNKPAGATRVAKVAKPPRRRVLRVAGEDKETPGIEGGNGSPSQRWLASSLCIRRVPYHW